jgi:hypothetical protein
MLVPVAFISLTADTKFRSETHAGLEIYKKNECVL